MKDEEIIIPLDIPKNMQKKYVKNYQTITLGSGNLFLFAGDQKVEHLNDDFVLFNVDHLYPSHLARMIGETPDEEGTRPVARRSLRSRCRHWPGCQGVVAGEYRRGSEATEDRTPVAGPDR